MRLPCAYLNELITYGAPHKAGGLRRASHHQPYGLMDGDNGTYCATPMAKAVSQSLLIFLIPSSIAARAFDDTVTRRISIER